MTTRFDHDSDLLNIGDQITLRGWIDEALHCDEWPQLRATLGWNEYYDSQGNCLSNVAAVPSTLLAMLRDYGTFENAKKAWEFISSNVTSFVKAVAGFFTGMFPDLGDHIVASIANKIKQFFIAAAGKFKESIHHVPRAIIAMVILLMAVAMLRLLNFVTGGFLTSILSTIFGVQVEFRSSITYIRQIEGFVA
jgi:hypothetical protein